MDFSYMGTGVVNFHGCPEVEVDYFFYYKFGLGAKVYDMISARRGRLEAVIVYKAWKVCDPRTAQTKTIYKDTYHWLHNEYDLGSQTEAVDAIDAYFNGKLEDVNKALSLLNC